MLLYSGNEQSVISYYASEDRLLLVLAGSHPRRQCEIEFLRRYARTEEISDNPRVISEKGPSEWSMAESALAFRMATILETDYFLPTHVDFGRITHQLPLLVTPSSVPVRITLDPAGSSIQLILSLYEHDFLAFGSLTKDFVRNVVFQKVSDLVPSSTRQGAEAFLKSIRRPREVFEYESSDLGDLPSIWQDVIEGRISIARATELSIGAARASVQVVESSAAAPMTDVVPDVIENEATLRQNEVQPQDNLEAAPAVLRQDKSSEAKLLLIGDGEPPLRGYRCFLAVTDAVRREHGSFFMQPHRTSVVWGGQKALFVFEHHSGQFGLYYDLQSREVISSESGGGAFPTYTIVLKNSIFIPVPEVIQASFIPKAGERKRFEIKCDYLHTGQQDRMG
jgi:molecular chaperone HtpG